MTTESSSWGSLKGKAASLLTIAITRLELLRNEAERIRRFAIRQLVLALVMVFCASLGVVLGIVTLTVAFWEQRLLVLGWSTAGLWLVVVTCLILLVTGKRQQEPLLNDSIAELQEDLRQLKAAIPLTSQAKDHESA
ncbi:MAG: hypothetical protein RIR79_1619 [Pseudomonadota bacterium]